MTEDERRQTGLRIRQARVQRGWTKVELGQAAGVTVNTIRKAENGGTVRDDTITALTTALELDTATYAPEVEMVRDIVGEWLEGMDRTERAKARKRIMRLIFGSADTR